MSCLSLYSSPVVRACLQVLLFLLKQAVKCHDISFPTRLFPIRKGMEKQKEAIQRKGKYVNYGCLIIVRSTQNRHFYVCLHAHVCTHSLTHLQTLKCWKNESDKLKQLSWESTLSGKL